MNLGLFFVPCCGHMYTTKPGNFIMSMWVYNWFQKTNAHACMFYSWNPDRVPHKILTKNCNC